MAVWPWLQCGGHQFCWRDLAHVLLTVEETGMASAFGYGLSYAIEMAAFDRRETSSSELLQLLHETKHKDATDPKDKVFALIGLARDKDVFDSLIDYQLSVQSVYLAIAEAYLSNGDLRVLNLAGDSAFNIVPHLPSWIPDWSRECRQWGPMLTYMFRKTFDEPNELKFVGQGGNAFNLAFSGRPYGAGGESLACPAIIEGGKILNLQGVVVDEVEAVGATVPAMAWLTQRMLITLFFVPWKHMASKINVYPTGESVSGVFARTITMDWAGNEHSIQAMHSAFEDAAKRQYYTSVPPVWQDTQNADHFRYLARLRHTIVNRSFFTTKKHYMGMGPTWVRPGDQVVVFRGGMTPFIIRKARKGCFQLVGEAYIHGMMYGEALSMPEGMQTISLI